MIVKMHRATKLFSPRPWSSLVLAILMLCLGLVFVSGWVPSSVVPRYFPGHEWIMAALCLVMALFFGYCARLGLGGEGQEVGRKTGTF